MDTKALGCGSRQCVYVEGGGAGTVNLVRERLLLFFLLADTRNMNRFFRKLVSLHTRSSISTFVSLETKSSWFVFGFSVVKNNVCV